MSAITIKNVTIGDKFRYNKHAICEVVDFMEYKSMSTGEICGYTCIVKGVNTLASNTFDVPFSMVVQHIMK